jgi:hypothetical protein
VQWCEADLSDIHSYRATNVNTEMNSDFLKRLEIYCLVDLLPVVRVCHGAYSIILDYFTFLVIMAQKSSPEKFIYYSQYFFQNECSSRYKRDTKRDRA